MGVGPASALRPSPPTSATAPAARIRARCTATSGSMQGGSAVSPAGDSGAKAGGGSSAPPRNGLRSSCSAMRLRVQPSAMARRLRLDRPTSKRRASEGADSPATQAARTRTQVSGPRHLRKRWCSMRACWRRSAPSMSLLSRRLSRRYPGFVPGIPAVCRAYPTPLSLKWLAELSGPRPVSAAPHWSK